jgi:halimadienyl-diphosphate synthase
MTMTYIEHAKHLVRTLDQAMGPSPYDIAWMARLQEVGTHTPLWPEFIEWLIQNQHDDGSWGGDIAYYHDRIICTLAASIALRINNGSRASAQARRRGETYLWHHLHMLPRDPFELVGFELIFPTLLDEAQRLGMDVPNHAGGYEKIQTEKLRLIPSQMLYSPAITTVHSLEFLGRRADTDRLAGAVFENGSLGNSPATTAYYASLEPGDDRPKAYLASVRDHMGYAIMLYPFRTYELIWVLNNLDYSGVHPTTFADAEVWDTLQSAMKPTGVSLDPTFGIPDGDNTAANSKLLTKACFDVDPCILARFEGENGGGFRTYPYERNPSVGTNAHALEALQVLPDYPDAKAMREKLIVNLLDSRVFNTYWIDKWHASPYYATAHALIGLMQEGNDVVEACHHTIDWLLHTQRDDGSWGFFEHGTAEETAFVLTALLHYHRLHPLDLEPLKRSAAYLARAYEEQEKYPALWIDKCLYAPYNIIRASILSALILYQDRVGAPL